MPDVALSGRSARSLDETVGDPVTETPDHPQSDSVHTIAQGQVDLEDPVRRFR